MSIQFLRYHAVTDATTATTAATLTIIVTGPDSNLPITATRVVNAIDYPTTVPPSAVIMSGIERSWLW